MPRGLWGDRQPWTHEEDAVLRQQYGKMPAKDLHTLLPGRTVAAVAGRLSKLGIREPREPDWTEVELTILREQFGRTLPRKIAKTLGRSVDAVKIKGKRLGLIARKRRLTPLAIGIMMHLCSKQVKRWIAKGWLKAEVLYRKDRTGHAVMPQDLVECLKAHPELWDARRCPDLHIKLGLTKKTGEAALGDRPGWLRNKLAADLRRGRKAARWTQAEHMQLAVYVQKGYTYPRIGDLMGRTAAGIERQVHRKKEYLWSLLKQQSA